MREAGVRFFKGEVAHHIVAQGLRDRWSVASRKLMDKMGVSIHDAANGAKVPDWFHQGADNFLHDTNTAKAIFKRLSEAAKSGTEAFKNELTTIGKEIEKAAKEASTVRSTGSRIYKKVE